MSHWHWPNRDSYDSGVLLNANATGVLRYWFSNSDAHKSLRKRSRSPKLTIELPIVKNACVFESRLSSISLTALFNLNQKNRHLHSRERSKTCPQLDPKSSKNGVWQASNNSRHFSRFPLAERRFQLKETSYPLSAKRNLLSAKGNSLSAKGNLLSAQGNKLSAGGNMLSAEGN